MNKEILILIPTKNELLNLDNLVLKLLKYFPNSVYLFVDDSSNDGTLERLDKLRSENSNIHVISRLGKDPNIALSYLEGYEFAQQKNIEYIGQIDCDGQHDVLDLKMMYESRVDFDVVIGSRYITGGQVLGWSKIRLLLSKVANYYLRLLFPQLHIEDATSGIRVIRTSATKKIWTDPPKSKGFSFHAESSVKAFKSGLKVKEHPITFCPRNSGKSKMNLKRAFESIYKFLLFRLG